MISGTVKIGDIELPWTGAEITHERRVVTVSVPGVPGQIVEDLGRGGYRATLAVTLCGNGWEDRLNDILFALDNAPEVDVRVADGRFFHAVLTGVSERWRLVDGVELRLDVVEDSQVDTILAAASEAEPESALRPWPAAATAAAELRALLADSGRMTLGELVAAYGALVDALNAAAAAADASTADGAETARIVVSAQATALWSLPVEARYELALSSGRTVLP